MRSLMAIFLISELILPINAFAVSKTVVIVPVHDGTSDQISKDLSEAFGKAFARQGAAVVSSEKVEAVMGYYRTSKANDDVQNSDAAEAISRAKEHYYNFDNEEASAQITRAIKMLEDPGPASLRTGAALRDAYVTAGIIERSIKGREKNSKIFFTKALKIDPSYVIDERAFAPSVVSAFSDAKKEVLGGKPGSIFADTDPKAAEVFINGIFKGVTPVTVSDLPEGNYSVGIRTNKYKAIEKEVAVRSGEVSKVKEKLSWMGGAGEVSSENHGVVRSKDEAVSQIAEGVRIADLLRVPKVVLIDADESGDGSGEILARMVDRKYKAGHNPVVIRYSADKKGLLNDLTQATQTLMGQFNAELAKNPQKYLDPDGTGDPVLLGKRKKPIYAAPAFWAILGGVLAASAGGAAAAVMMSGGDDSAPATGSVNVQFK